ncbi:MAG: sugar porter family MFS transporter, partial [Candidatus Eremiobacteraeota bacterium]|nr:sugar porter family MFS transporter [Candidatus Eremiobacteraeota bacterium]
MNKRVIFWSITVALGGFLFGFDTAVISGAEQSIQKLWSLSDGMHGLAVAIALYGTVLGAFFGGVPADRYGRKKTLFGVGVLYLVSALGSAMAPEVFSFMFFRFLGGIGVGASSVAAPMYISEISPTDKRGRLTALFQFNIVTGILCAYMSNYLLTGLGGVAWRWMLGVEAIPALAFTLMVLAVPRSPRWLYSKHGDAAAAREVLDLIDPSTAEVELEAIKKQKAEEANCTGKFFSRRYSFSISLAVLLAIFNQISGINAIIYYAPRIFEMTGLGASAALMSSAGVGLVNLLATVAAIAVIDRFGRRSLMLVGSVGLITSLALVARAFYLNSFTGVPILIFLFIASFAVSQGCVLWVYLSEIFPSQVRANAQSLGSFTHWTCAALVAN